ncbi:MAG TPA: hypothetical protein VFA11_18300 [Acidimicrobiales bacterium]|nr:hypothetical protein [Acidimicrobiales bacterium]
MGEARGEASPRQRLRRKLANELLAAAAQHAIVTDELQELERRRRGGELSNRDLLRVQELRRRKLMARLRHDRAHRRLVGLLATGVAVEGLSRASYGDGPAV